MEAVIGYNEVGDVGEVGGVDARVKGTRLNPESLIRLLN